jgi:hypothetical protein
MTGIASATAIGSIAFATFRNSNDILAARGAADRPTTSRSCERNGRDYVPGQDGPFPDGHRRVKAEIMGAVMARSSWTGGPIDMRRSPSRGASGARDSKQSGRRRLFARAIEPALYEDAARRVIRTRYEDAPDRAEDVNPDWSHSCSSEVWPGGSVQNAVVELSLDVVSRWWPLTLAPSARILSVPSARAGPCGVVEQQVALGASATPQSVGFECAELVDHASGERRGQRRVGPDQLSPRYPVSHEQLNARRAAGGGGIHFSTVHSLAGENRLGRVDRRPLKSAQVGQVRRGDWLVDHLC